MTLVWYMRDADIQNYVSIRQSTMQGWTQEVWTAVSIQEFQLEENVT